MPFKQQEASDWAFLAAEVINWEWLVQVLEEAGFSFYLKSPTNQQFVILENRQMERLAKKVAFSFWETLDEDHTAVRFVTSWATDPQNLEALWEILAQEAGQKA